MKRLPQTIFAVVLCICIHPALSQSATDTTLLGLPGDNLNLAAVLSLFQQSKTIEAFEKSLNEEKTGLNNLDLNLDKKVDFIKVVTKQKDSSFTFILQVHVDEKETQDVAVILLDKEKNGKISLQIVGDKELYGEGYILEPNPAGASVTPNPAYKGEDPVVIKVPPTTVVVEQSPIVQYVYSPVYVPYTPPYYYNYYPAYFAAFTVMAVGIYHHNHYYHHHGYHHTTVIHNNNNFNNYNGDRNYSDRVQHNKADGRYNSGNRASTQPANRPGGGTAGNRPSNQPSNRPGAGASAGTRPTGQPSNKSGLSGSNRASTTPSNRSSNGYSGSRSSNYSGASSWGGGRSRGGGGGGFRGGGGGGRRR